MKATKTQKEFWHSLHEYGDFGKIEAESGINRRTISETFASGVGKSDTIAALNTFYSTRKKNILGQAKEVKQLRNARA